MHAEVVGDLTDDPQSVAVLAGPVRITGGIGLGWWSDACRCDFWVAIVHYLAAQHAVVHVDDQPPVTGAVADRVDGEFMGRKNDVHYAGLRHPGLGDVGGHGRAQRVQRPGTEFLLQHRRAVRTSTIGPGGRCRIGGEFFAG